MKPNWPHPFEQLVDEHQSMVFTLALRITADRGLAEEITQDVFLEMDTHIAKLESPDHLRNWLRAVTISRSRDALRRRNVRQWANTVEIEEHHVASSTQLNSPLATRIEQLLHTLPEQQRTAILLRYQEDMTPTEIAAVLKAPLATVKSNLQRGLNLLREKSALYSKEYVREA